MSERDDKPEAEDEMTRVIEPESDEIVEGEEWIDSESESAGWEEEDEELPPRPRSRLLAPLPIFLVAVLIGAAGFLGGVLVQKGSEDGQSAGGFPGGGELPAFAAQGGGGAEAAGGLPAGLAGSSDAAVTGTVSSVDGRTIYVKDGEGNTVAVKAGDGSTITREANSGVKKIRPGDSIVVQGSKNGSTVRASSISATEAGVETGLPAVSPGGSAEAGGDPVESLFGE